MSLPENPSQTAADSTSSMEFQVTSLPVALLVACLALSACSSQQMYSSGQAHKRSECNRIENAQERAACMKQADTSYETYKKETGSDKY